MKNLFFGVHGGENLEGGQYQILPSFGIGVYKALKNKGMNVDYVPNYFNKGIIPHVSIGFNVYGKPVWKDILEAGATNIMWNVDSVFFNNFEAIKEYSNYPQFVLLNVAQADNESVKNFFPHLNSFYIPHGVDTDLWKPSEDKKEHDIVFMSSLSDFEEEMNSLKNSLSSEGFELFKTIYGYTMANPDKTFWEVFNNFVPVYGFDKNNLDTYKYLFHSVCYTTTHAKRVQMIQKLKNYNIKIWGSELWQKYVQGNVQYMGRTNLDEAVKIVQNSKIVLHLQPFQILNGLHERVLNAAASGAYVISDNNPEIRKAFGENISYFNNHTFENLEEGINYYLKNNKERVEKTVTARETVLLNHRWENRIETLLELFKVK